MTKKRLFEMVWGIDKDGYQITGDRILPTGKKWKQYDPFQEETGLARKFANIGINGGKIRKDGALAFANRYGLLGVDNSSGVEGEDLQAWTDAVYALRYIFKNIKKDQEEALYAFNGNFIALPMRLSIYNKGKPNEQTFQMTPTTLYGAFWLMTADEIVKGVQYKPCKAPGCPEWFPIRSNKKFCSDACKQAAYRKRSG